MNENDFIPDSITLALRNLIIHYLNRRRETVVEIMIQLRAPIMKQYEIETILGIDLTSYCNAFKERDDNPLWHQRGIWRGEWEHWFHGIGCRLTHLKTGELFDWDASDPRHFFAWEFIHHLNWRIENETDVNLELLKHWEWTRNSYDLEKYFDVLEHQQILGKLETPFVGVKWRLLK